MRLGKGHSSCCSRERGCGEAVLSYMPPWWVGAADTPTKSGNRPGKYADKAAASPLLLLGAHVPPSKCRSKGVGSCEMVAVFDFQGFQDCVSRINPCARDSSRFLLVDQQAF